MADIFPDEILVLIFSKLHGGILLRCGAVCKNWCRVINSDYLWYPVLSRELNYDKSFTKEQNLKINKQISDLWKLKDRKSLKTIYVEERRKENPKSKVFPIEISLKANMIDDFSKPPKYIEYIPSVMEMLPELELSDNEEDND